jgi:lipopolysaccharide export system permease protein
MACLIAMILAFGRLSSDYELIAMRASGISPASLVTPVLTAGLVLSMLLVVMNDRVVPSTHLASIGMKQPAAYLEAGTFIKEFSPYTIYVYQVEGQQMTDVRIYEPQEDGPTRTIVASRGEFESLPDRRGVQLKLHDGTIDQWDPEHPGSFAKVEFRTYSMTLRAEREDVQRLKKKLKEMTLQELVDERRALAPQGIDATPVSLELHRRIASSFSVLVFIMFGLALGLRLHHHERLTGYVWVLGIFLCYYLSNVGMNAVALKGWLPPWVTMWLPNLVGAAVSGVLIARAVRR